MPTAECSSAEVHITTEERKSRQPWASTTEHGTNGDHAEIQVTAPTLRLLKKNKACTKQCETCLSYLPNQYSEAHVNLHAACALSLPKQQYEAPHEAIPGSQIKC